MVDTSSVIRRKNPMRQAAKIATKSSRDLFGVSASGNRRSENVVIESVVIFELTFRDVERQIFAADFVIAADNRPFEDAPKAFNRIRVDRADHVAVRGMPTALMVVLSQVVIDFVFIGRKQADLGRYNLAHKFFCFEFADRAENAGNDVALAL